MQNIPEHLENTVFDVFIWFYLTVQCVISILHMQHL